MTSSIASNKPTKSIEMAETNLTGLSDGEIGGPIHDEATESARITQSVDFDISDFPWQEEVRPGLDCPFYWESTLHTLSYGDHEIDPLSEFEELSEEPSFSLRNFHRFKTQLILCYHNFYKRLVEDSMKNIDEMERIIHLSAVEECDALFLGREDAMLRVVYSCRYFIVRSTNQTQEAEKIFEKVERYMAMSKANQAMSWAIRAAVFVEYGYEPVRTAIACMTTAIGLDSGNAFWPLLKGLYLGRLRRMGNVTNELPEKEIENLKMALKKRRDPVFYSFTAETYLEVAEIIEKKVNTTESCGLSVEQLSSWSDEYMKLATRFFTKSVEGKDDSAHLLFRYGRALMRLRHPHRDLVKAEELLRRGLKLSPKSSYGNYAMAVFIMNHKEDWEAAKLYLEKSAACRNFHAHLDLCREGFLRDEISVSVELKKLLDVYKETPKICKIYGELILYRLLVRYNLVEACSYAKFLISFQTTWIDYIYNFTSSIFPLPERVPLLKLLTSEINNELFQESSEMKKNAYKTFLHYIFEEKIQTPENIPANILSRYSEDMKEGMLRQCQFPLVKSEVKKKHDETKNKLRNRRSRNSSSKEYHKYYTATKNRTVCDILPPQTEGRMMEVRRKHKNHFQRRYSGSSSERSVSDREVPIHLVKGLESLAISETGTSGVKEHTSSEIFSSRDKRQRSPKVDNHSSSSESGRKTLRESSDNRSPNSSLERKSVNSFQGGQVNSRCARSSPESKSSGSHRKRRYPHSRNREDSGSDSCNSRSGQSHRNDESKRRHRRREDSEEKSSRPDREYRQRQYKSHDDGHYNSSRYRKDRSSSESTYGSECRKDSEKSSGSERENRRLQRKSRDDRSCSYSRSRKSRSGSESTNESEHRKDSEKFSGSEREHFRCRRRDSEEGSRNSARSREKRSSSESMRRSKRHKYFDKKSSRSDREYLRRQRRSRGDGSCSSSSFRTERSSSESMNRNKRHKNPNKKSSRSDREHRRRSRRRCDDSYKSRYRGRYSDESARKSERRKNRDKELSRSDHYRQRRSRDDSCSSSSSRSCHRYGSDDSTRRRDYREGYRRRRSRRERSYSFDRSRRHLRNENYPKRNKSKRPYTHGDSNDL